MGKRGGVTLVVEAFGLKYNLEFQTREDAEARVLDYMKLGCVPFDSGAGTIQVPLGYKWGYPCVTAMEFTSG